MTRKLASLVLVFALPVSLLADGDTAKHSLRYKFKTGDTLRWEVDQRSSVSNTMEGTTQKAQTKTVSLKVWKVIDVIPDGEIEFLNLVERVRMENKLPDRAPMIFDSTLGDEPPPGFEDAARAVGVPLSSIRMSPRGEVIDRDIKHHQPAADPHEQVVLLLPKGPIAIGESWTQPIDVLVKIADGGQKSISAQRKHTLKSVSAGVATIETQFQVLSPTSPEIDAQMAHRLVKGEIRFDVDKGRVLSQRLEVDHNVIGFAGASSSMHLVTRLEESLQEGPTEVASKP